MKKLLAVILLAFVPSFASADWPIDWAWNSVGGGFSCWNYSQGSHSIDTSTVTPDPSSSLRFTYNPNFEGGKDPASCSNDFGTGKTEVYGQYYFKYSANWTWHGTVNKHLFIWYGMPIATTAGDVIGVARTARQMQIRLQYAGTRNLEGNVGSNPTIQTDTWYKVNYYFKINTPGTSNGVARLWLNDVLLIDYSDVKWLGSGETRTGFARLAITPTWGGTGGTKSGQAEYLWLDRTIAQPTPIGAMPSPGDISPPYTDSHSPAKYAAGVPVGNRTVSFYVRDAASQVSRSSISMTISGVSGAKTCSSGLTCSPGGSSATAYSVSYTHPEDWAKNTTYGLSFTARDTENNTLNDGWTFSTERETPPATSKTKAQLLAYLQELPSLPAKKLISGQRVNWLELEEPWKETNAISAKTGGVLPGVVGYDFRVWDDDTPYESVQSLVDYWNSGGLIVFMHHAANPSRVKNDWQWPLGDPWFEDFSQIYTPGSTIYNNYRHQLERIGDKIQALADNGVTIVFAPLHEGNIVGGRSFWWYDRDPLRYKTAYEYVRHYLGVERGLNNNILWMYTVAPHNNYNVTNHYPGDNNVDIIGVDLYSGNSRFNDSSIITRWNQLKAYGKPMVVSELGLCSSSTRTDETCSGGDARTIVNDISTYFPDAVWWMNWDDEDVDYGMGNMNYVPQALADPRVVVLSDNPSGGEALEPLSVVTATLPSGKVGVSYSASLSATGGETPYAWDNTAPLPGGLSLGASSGVISGVPISAFSGNVSVRVTDTNAQTASKALSLTIEASDKPSWETGEITGVEDTYLNSGSPVSNYSTADKMTLYVWPANTIGNVGLLKWDVSDIPANTVIQSATLQIYVTGYEGGGGADVANATVHRITGVSPVVGVATWETYNGTQAWSGGADGGLSDIGGVEGTMAMTKTPGYYTVDVTSMVREWVASPSTNKGMMIRPPAIAVVDTNRHIASADHPAAEYRPVLFLSYATAPEAPTLINVSLIGGTVN